MLRAAVFSLACMLAYANPSAAVFCGPGTVLDAELGGCVVAPDRSFRSGSTGPQMKTLDGSIEFRVDSGKDVSVLIGDESYSLNLGRLEARFKSVEDAVAANAVNDKVDSDALAQTVTSSIDAAAKETDTKLSALQGSIEQDLQPTINALAADVTAAKKDLSKQVNDLTSTTAGSIADLKKTIDEDVAAKLATSKKTVDAQTKQLADQKKKLDYFDAVIELNTKKKSVPSSGNNVVGPLNKKYPAPRHNNYGPAMPDGRGWKLPSAGVYWVTYTMRTFHDDGQSGFTKVRLYDNTKKSAISSSTTMISEYRSASRWGQTQKEAGGFHRVEVTQKTDLTLIAWHNCNGNNQKCGWTNDISGMEEFIYVKIAEPDRISYKYSTSGARRSSGGWWSWYTRSNRWNLPKTGKYLLFFTCRTYQGNTGFGKMRLYNSRAGGISRSERMVTEVQGTRGYAFTNHVASGVYLYDNKHAGSYSYTQYYATAGGIGWQSDSNGHNHFIAVKVDSGSVGEKAQNPESGDTGRKDYRVGSYAKVNGYHWDLPGAGTYILFCTLRSYHGSPGKALVKLDVNTAENNAKLLAPDKGGVKYGSTVRMQEYWLRKPFSFTNHIMTWSWQVTVTGKMQVGLYGKADRSEIGVQNDSNGWSSCIWWKPPTMETEPTLLLPQ